MGYFLGKETLAVPMGETTNPGGATAATAAPAGGGAGTPSPSGSERDALIEKCKAQCGGMVEPCFSQCLYKAGGGDVLKPCAEGKTCVTDSDCGTGKCFGTKVDTSVTPKRITAGKCSCNGQDPGGGDAGCPEGKGSAYEGCACGEEYPTKTGRCVAGYQFERHPYNDKGEGTVGLCVCQKALSEWQGKKGGTLGEYSYPAGMQELMTLLMNRGKGFYGYDPAAIEAMFGRGFEKARGQEAGQRERLNRTLQTQGMLGTGAAVEQGNDLGFATEEAINNLARDIMIKNEEQKRTDTELLSSILGRGMGFEQLLEAINAGRRGEGQNSLAMLLSLLQLFKG